MEADLLNEDSLKDAVEGCQFVVHTASPVAYESPANHDDIIKPAVNGVDFIMKAAR